MWFYSISLLKWDTGTEDSTIEEINSIVISHIIPTGMILFLLYDTKGDGRQNVQAAHLHTLKVNEY